MIEIASCSKTNVSFTQSDSTQVSAYFPACFVATLLAFSKDSESGGYGMLTRDEVI